MFKTNEFNLSATYLHGKLFIKLFINQVKNSSLQFRREPPNFFEKIRFECQVDQKQGVYKQLKQYTLEK